MRTKAQPYQLDESDKIILASNLQMSSPTFSKQSSPVDIHEDSLCSKGSDTTDLNNSNENTYTTTQADSTSSDDPKSNTSNNNSLASSPSTRHGYADKSTQKDFDINGQIRNRMREFERQIHQNVFTHRYQIRKINEIQAANFELHRQNQILYHLLNERRPDIANRVTKRQHHHHQTPQATETSPPPLRPVNIDLQHHQYLQQQQQQLQQQYLYYQQLQNKILQEQRQQAATDNTQYGTCTAKDNQGNTMVTPPAKVKEFESMAPPAGQVKGLEGDENNNVFVTQWVPSQQEASENAVASEMGEQSSQLSHHSYQACAENEANNSQEIPPPKLAHPSSRLNTSPASMSENKTFVMTTEQQQYCDRYYHNLKLFHKIKQQMSITHPTATSHTPNATTNTLVTPPPSPMCSPYAVNNTSASARNQASSNQNQAYFFPPGAQSPQYYYQKWPTHGNMAAQRRGQPY